MVSLPRAGARSRGLGSGARNSGAGLGCAAPSPEAASMWELKAIALDLRNSESLGEGGLVQGRGGGGHPVPMPFIIE